MTYVRTIIFVTLGATFISAVMNDNVRAAPEVVHEQRLAKNDKAPRDKIKEAGRACFSTLKEKLNASDILFEGGDVLKRNGETYHLRIRTLKHDPSGTYLRTTYVCDVIEATDTWSVVKVELPH